MVGISCNDGPRRRRRLWRVPLVTEGYACRQLKMLGACLLTLLQRALVCAQVEMATEVACRALQTRNTCEITLCTEIRVGPRGHAVLIKLCMLPMVIFNV